MGGRIREIADPADLAVAAAELLGNRFGVSRAGYGTIDLENETIIIDKDCEAPGIKSVVWDAEFQELRLVLRGLEARRHLLSKAGPRTGRHAGALRAISAQV